MILLVEDNINDEKLTIRAFKKNNYTSDIVVARDGVEALDFLFGREEYEDRDTGHQPQIILLDLKLPRMSGLEVLAQIRQDERTKLIPVIVLSTSDELADRRESYRLGANSYIQKPVDFHEFVETIDLIGKYWLVVNKPPQ